jgi:hypothetical protein
MHIAGYTYIYIYNIHMHMHIIFRRVRRIECNHAQIRAVYTLRDIYVYTGMSRVQPHENQGRVYPNVTWFKVLVQFAPSAGVQGPGLRVEGVVFSPTQSGKRFRVQSLGSKRGSRV